ncbi:unnamed protein product [Caenorhabditis angaria]|uniref:Uncharacterized protein n=1 Tax=Caenorhabditis angaria TaxID=860376 RepID=A0A9P1ILE7_9PELO|nr:unnamed protein product [Caenorhabditis angaria]
MKKLLILLLYSAIFLIQVEGAEQCRKENFGNIVVTGDEDYLIYGLTQDCQMFFARPSQLHLVSQISINRQLMFCASNLIQFHLKSHDTLLLTFKQAHNRICTIDVHIPTVDMIIGDHLFLYSLRNTLPYAACSHSLDRSFSLEPDLSFMDPIYQDVIYFVDALSKGSKWKTLQFVLKDTGTLSMMNNLTMRNVHLSDEVESSEFVLTIDNRRDKLFRRNKYGDYVDYQCGFELLFRPDLAKVKKFKTPKSYGNLVNGQSVEEDIMIYTETDRTSTSQSRLKILNLDQPEDVYCLLSTNFAFDVGIIRQSSLDYLKSNPLPLFGTKIRLHSKTTKKPKSQAQTPKTIANIRITTSTATPESIEKTSSVAYSPSESFFRFETATDSESEAETFENSEEDSEIARELSTDLNELSRDANLTRRYLADNETIIESDAVKSGGTLFSLSLYKISSFLFLVIFF